MSALKKALKVNNDLSKESCVTDADFTKKNMFRIFMANAEVITIVSLLA